MIEPCDLPARTAAELIRAGKLSIEDLTESCIARTLDVDPAVNAMVVRDFDGARAAARASDRCDRSRPDVDVDVLRGLPVGAKLSDDVRGLSTTHSSPIYVTHVAAADAPHIARLRGAGAIILGKTNAPEFNAGANTRSVVHGATGNPFAPALSAAGSSGGSAVALACGMVPLATGSDLGGSLRNPAAFCGVVGMRPSPETIDDATRGMDALPLSVVGPMGRTVDDVALMLGVMRSQPPMRACQAAGALSDIRVAATPDFGFAPVDDGVRDTFAAIVRRVARVTKTLTETTPDCAGVARAFAVLRGVLFLGAHRQHWANHRDALGPNIVANYTEAEAYTAADVADALIAQTAFARRVRAFFDSHDVLIAPAVAVSPFPWTERSPAVVQGRPMQTYYEWLSLAYPATLAGCPTLSLPVGRDARGMPFGLQIVGARGADQRVLFVAGLLESAFADDAATARPVPDLAALRAAPPIADAPGFLA